MSLWINLGTTKRKQQRQQHIKAEDGMTCRKEQAGLATINLITMVGTLLKAQLLPVPAGPGEAAGSRAPLRAR